MSGVFITVEGGEGVGKSTQLVNIREHLERAGKHVLMTREPGGTPFAEAIRDLLLAPRAVAVAPDAELLLMFAARAAHLHEVIWPALESGLWVVCDRFTDATYAYQGGGRGISSARIATLESFVQGDFRPHATLLLDAPIEVGLKRASERAGEPDRFERENAAFFQRVRDSYLAMVAREPQRFHVINAAQPLEQVTRDTRKVLDRLLEQYE